MDFLYHNVISKLSMNYNYLYIIVHDVEKEFSLTTFLLLCSQWFNLNEVLLSYILYEGEMLSYSLGCLMIAQFSFAVILNVGVILCASRISYQVFRVQNTLQLMYNKIGTTNSSPVQILKNMLDIKFPKMTAYGVLKLTPYLIASSFGSVLTYGLLVINVNRC
ncbi:techylectin-5A [Caerostris extrusa]|uniref:Techylectin-5A n=1 Tax=Caerostris extrusa TaxID=172846 RepID=A0AAV4UZ21_CAEEX|nr:techylectin-5A [Caerostris extrusa]